MEKGIYTNAREEKFECDLLLSGKQLYIYLQDDKKNLLIWDLKNSFFEWQGSRLIVSKAGEKLECSWMIAKQLTTPHEFGSAEKVKKPYAIKPVHVFFAIMGIAIISAALLVYFYTIPWVAEKSARFIPMDLEVKMGEKLANSIAAGAHTNDSVNFYAARFIAPLELETEYPVKVTIIDSEEINAFALPGGNIFVYTGLLKKMDSYEQLVALLGHELTHVTKQHSLKSILRGAAAGIVIGGLFGDFGGLGSWLLTKADEFKQLDYSRELETEADNNGLQMMVNNKVDPKGMLGLLKVLKQEGQETPGLMKYLSTHPETDARISNVSANPLMKQKFPENERLKQAFIELQTNIRNFK